jgi:hypothetical protein
MLVFLSLAKVGGVDKGLHTVSEHKHLCWWRLPCVSALASVRNERLILQEKTECFESLQVKGKEIRSED